MDKEKEGMPNRRRRSKQIQKNNKKLDRLLNYLIVIVSILIVISAVFIFTNTKDQSTSEKEPATEKINSKKETSTLEESSEKKSVPSSEITKEMKEQPSDSEEQGTDPGQKNTVIETASASAEVEKVVVDASWKVTPTTQSGPHISSYEEASVDWQEKVATLLTTAGLSEDQAIIWSMKNNGGPESAIGVVSSKDKKQKYRVTMAWVENEGWKPVKLEILKTLEGTY